MAKRNEFILAGKRASDLRREVPRAVGAQFDRRTGRIVIRLSTGIEVGFSPRDTQGLERAKPSQLEEIEITPSGFGIHFPKLDADIYLPALLEGFLGSRKWMATRLGALGGRSRSKAKTFASRMNGKLGGRPRKIQAKA